MDDKQTKCEPAPQKCQVVMLIPPAGEQERKNAITKYYELALTKFAELMKARFGPHTYNTTTVVNLFSKACEAAAKEPAVQAFQMEVLTPEQHLPAGNRDSRYKTGEPHHHHLPTDSQQVAFDNIGRVRQSAINRDKGPLR